MATKSRKSLWDVNAAKQYRWIAFIRIVFSKDLHPLRFAGRLPKKVNQDNSPPTPVPGQRWASNLEPELGLGIIQTIEDQSAVVSFPACEETRRYSRDSSPLYRVRFQTGATVRSEAGVDCIVTRVSESDGLLTYHGGNFELPEQELHASMTDRSPVERLLQGQTTDNDLFELRLNAMNMMGEHPWALSFSYGRALQQSALHAWNGNNANLESTYTVFYHRAEMNSKACHGEYSPSLEI